MLNFPTGHVFQSIEIPSAAPRQRLHLILLGVRSVAHLRSVIWVAMPCV